MRIGIDARMYGPKAATGLGSYIQELIKHISLIDSQNEYVIFMNKPAHDGFVETKNIKKVLVNCPWYSFAEQIKLPFVFAKYKLDVLHVPHFNAPIFYLGKIIVTIHDLTPISFPGPKVKKSWFRKIAYFLVLKGGLKKASQIITISNHTKKLLVEKLNIKEKKINVIHLGLNTLFEARKHQTLPEDLKNKLNIKKNYLLYIGVWRDHKNLPTLIKAYGYLRSQKEYQGQLVLSGKPDDRYPEIMAEIKKSDFIDDIILPGFIENKDLGYVYAGADIFVLPSFQEGFGLVALEAASCETPVIASKSTSLPEVMGEAAVYFDPHSYLELAESIKLVLNDDLQYQKMQQAGLKQCELYNWQTCASETINIYQKIKSVV